MSQVHVLRQTRARVYAQQACEAAVQVHGAVSSKARYLLRQVAVDVLHGARLHHRIQKAVLLTLLLLCHPLCNSRVPACRSPAVGSTARPGIPMLAHLGLQ